MTDRELAKALNLTVFHEGEPREVCTGYCGDLLSWVMGRAPVESAWFTVMNNNNVAAVAVLREMACVILTQGVEPDGMLLARMKSEDISLYGSAEDAYTLAVKTGMLLAEV